MEKYTLIFCLLFAAYYAQVFQLGSPKIKIAEFSKNFIPCGGKPFCGDVLVFNSDEDFEDFLQEFYPNPNRKKSRVQLKLEAQLAQLLFQKKSCQAKLAVCEDRVGSLLNQIRSLRFDLSLARNQILVETFNNQPMAIIQASMSMSGPDESLKYSQTNNQIETVDEADIIKTDGSFIYTISNSYFTIVQSYPIDEIEQKFSEQITEFQPKQILLSKNYVCVIGYKSLDHSTVIRIYDITDRNSIIVIKNIYVSGEYFTARKLDSGYSYIITKNNFQIERKPWTKVENTKVNIAPSSRFYYLAGPYLKLTGFNIFTFNLNDPVKDKKTKAITICSEDASVIYMSQSNIYIASNKTESNEFYTTIRKISAKKDKIVPFASGKVKGTVNNQFSLDQYKGYLRVATTESNPSNSRDYYSSNVFVLDFYLKITGELRNIAKSQRIYACRFIKYRLYLVTFRKIDPFFVISLTNNKPSILGELKIPGFSTYLHPYDQNNIIGIGRNFNDKFGGDSSTFDVVVTLFDVSEVSSPKQAYRASFKSASSIAFKEHKSFYFSKEQNLLVIPIIENSQGSALALKLEDSSILQVTKIPHINPNSNLSEEVQRTLTIQDQYIYTKSKCIIQVTQISDLNILTQIDTPC